MKHKKSSEIPEMEGNLGVLYPGAQERMQGSGAVFPKLLPENFLEQGEKRN